MLLSGLTTQENSEVEKQQTQAVMRASWVIQWVCPSYRMPVFSQHTSSLAVGAGEGVGEFLPSSKGPTDYGHIAHTCMTKHTYGKTCTNMYIEPRPHICTHMRIHNRAQKCVHTHRFAHTCTVTYLIAIPLSGALHAEVPPWREGRGGNCREIREGAKAEWAHGCW